MKRYLFWAILVLIATGGLFLRLNNYDRTPPFGETMDEFMYPFAGISLLKTGVATSWSPFMAYTHSYEETISGVKFRMVTPWLDKPPLYPLLAGTLSLMHGEAEFSQVRMSTFRLLPVFLSFFTILLVGLVGAVYFHPAIGLLSSLLYATIPTIVLGNRLGLTENLLVPLSLFGLWLFQRYTSIIPAVKNTTAYVIPGLSRNLFNEPELHIVHIIALGLICGLIVTTKQIGITLPFTLIFLLLTQRKWRSAIILALITLPFTLINPLMGYFSDWSMYQNMLREFNWAHTLGLPETIATLFRIPGIGHKESVFLDGTMLLGFILFFSSPFWLSKETPSTHNPQLTTHNLQPTTYNLLLYPFFYLTALTLLEGGQTWYGWHLFPLYPFLAILVAVSLFEFYQKPELPQFLVLFMILAASSLRFFMLIHPEVIKSWQTILLQLLILSIGSWFLLRGRWRNALLAGLGILFVCFNIYTVLHLSDIYPTKPQPVNQPVQNI